MKKPNLQVINSYKGAYIVFIYRHQDFRLTGKLVGIDSSDNPVIFLPQSPKHKNGYYPIHNGKRFTWYCGWKYIEFINTIGRQLEFNFMRFNVESK